MKRRQPLFSLSPKTREIVSNRVRLTIATPWTAYKQKRVVWRCINRLDYGKKYCKESATIDEKALQNAIMAGGAGTSFGTGGMRHITAGSLLSMLSEWQA